MLIVMSPAWLLCCSHYNTNGNFPPAPLIRSDTFGLLSCLGHSAALCHYRTPRQGWSSLTRMHGQLDFTHAHAHCEIASLAALHHHAVLAPWICSKEVLLSIHRPCLCPACTSATCLHHRDFSTTELWHRQGWKRRKLCHWSHNEFHTWC